MAPPTGTCVARAVSHKLKTLGGFITPIFVPRAHAKAPMARNFGRSLSVVMSLIMTVASARHPPPPKPCTTRAAINQLIFCAHPQRMLPRVNKRIANIMIHLRPLELKVKM